MTYPSTIVVIGVSGSGKSTIASSVAKRLGFDFCEADDLHSVTNVEMMRGGQALSDAQRVPWLHAVGRAILDAQRHHQGVVVACSALRRRYRDIIRDYDASTYFLLLVGSPELIASRVSSRTHEFMPASLLSSQFASLEGLEADERGQEIDVFHSADSIVTTIVRSLEHVHRE